MAAYVGILVKISSMKGSPEEITEKVRAALQRAFPQRDFECDVEVELEESAGPEHGTWGGMMDMNPTGEDRYSVLMDRERPWPKACRFGQRHMWMVGKDKHVYACGVCGRVKGHDDVQVVLGRAGWLIDLPAALAQREATR